MVNFLKRFYIAKPHFTVADVRFDTQEVLDGFFSYFGDQSKGITRYALMPERLPLFSLFSPLGQIPVHHSQLHSNFTTLARSTSLSSAPQLGITAYNLPVAGVLGSGEVVIDATVLKILTPPEADGVLSHELAHIEKGEHKVSELTIRRAHEFAADWRAAEITKDPKALLNGIAKLEQFNEEARAASPFLAKVHAFGKGMIHLGAILKGKAVDGIHPSLAERTARLSTFTERLAQEAVQHTHIKL